METKAIWILTVIAAYFALWMLLSWKSSKGADNSTFFSGNRKMAWPLVAIAMIGAPISGVTFISVPGMVITKGFSYLQMCLGFVVGYIVIALVLVPLYYKLNIISVYGYLEKRFGTRSYKTGAWLFIVSKLFGISIRFLIICVMLQLLVFDPLGIPYVVSVGVSMILIWLSTYKGGVKSVIWTDVLKSFCLISVILICVVVISSELGYSFSDLGEKIFTHDTSEVFHFDDPFDGRYFWKQFIGGIFIVIAMTGLDQDMMQRTLACRNSREACKHLVVSSVMQFVVIGMLLMLGTLMVMFLQTGGMELPEKTDNLFATIAFHSEIPIIVGLLFILGIVSATCSSVGSALTSMTTSVTIDILEADKNGSQEELGRKKGKVHIVISLLIALLVLGFYYLNEDDAISMVYTLVSYTDGPILGLFLFGILTKRKVRETLIPVVCMIAPVICWVVQWSTRTYFGYEIGFELLILNAGLTFCALYGISSSIPVSYQLGTKL